MLFLVISSPRPERPSAIAASRRQYWEWLAPLQRSGTCKWTYARTGRGAVALFDVGSNELLHRLLNEWAEIVPAAFDIYPLIDPNQAQDFLRGQRKRRAAEPAGRLREATSPSRLTARSLSGIAERDISLSHVQGPSPRRRRGAARRSRAG